MTHLQKTKFYFPAWNRAFRSNWRRLNGRIEPLEDRVECLIRERPDAPMINLTSKVESHAAARALQHHRAVTADDLRHACHVVALGRDKSSDDLTNAELERVVHLFRLLADTVAFYNPEEDTRRRLIWFLEKKVKRQYLESVCLSEYQTRNFRSLSTDRLHNLVRTLKHRPNAELTPAPAAAPDPELVPF